MRKRIMTGWIERMGMQKQTMKKIDIHDYLKKQGFDVSEYSSAMKPLFRNAGYQHSGDRVPQD